jgi:hypothetical protein
MLASVLQTFGPLMAIGSLLVLRVVLGYMRETQIGERGSFRGEHFGDTNDLIRQQLN